MHNKILISFIIGLLINCSLKGMQKPFKWKRKEEEQQIMLSVKKRIDNGISLNTPLILANEYDGDYFATTATELPILKVARIKGEQTTDLLKVMLKHGANPNINEYAIGQEIDPCSLPLHEVCALEDYEKAAVLLDHGADVNQKQLDRCNQTIFHCFVSHNSHGVQNYEKYLEILKKMFRTAQINIKANNGDTPLHNVIRHYCQIRCGFYSDSKVAFLKKIINLLLFHGANLNIKNCRGRSPLDIAIQSYETYCSGQPELVEHLKKDARRVEEFLSGILQRCGLPKEIARYISGLRYNTIDPNLISSFSLLSQDSSCD